MVLIYEWLFAGLFWIGAVLFVIGALLLICPLRTLSATDSLNRWISTGPLFNRLDEQIHLERKFYRHHRLMGAFIVLGALYCLYSLTQWANYEQIIMRMITAADADMTGIAVDSMLIALGLGNIAALLVGVVVFMRPSLLKRLESWTNRWVGADAVTDALDRQVDLSGGWLPRYPRFLGLLTLIGSLYIMSNTAIIALT